ncbi:hypothetical protein HK104_008289 [Borealophlyctis nickersoniae]|nr:hypothetical protein HK104_008289 [Borealophlyctis nickersoniae]
MYRLPTPAAPATTTGSFPPPPTFANRYLNRRPLFVKSLSSLSAAVSRWSDEYLAQQIPNALGADTQESIVDASKGILKVLLSSDGRRFLDDRRYTDKVDMDVQELLRRCGTGGVWDHAAAQAAAAAGEGEQRVYYRGHLSQSMLDDLNIPGLLDGMFGATASPKSGDIASEGEETGLRRDRPTVAPHLVRLWVSTAGCVTPLHYDRCHGLLLQLRGTKRFLVFPRDDAANLYLQDGVSGPSHASKVRGADRVLSGTGDEEEVSDVVRRFPKITSTDPLLVTLKPGDVLYTPPGFLHEVTSLTGGISVTVPWDMNKDELDDLPAYMAF